MLDSYFSLEIELIFSWKSYVFLMHCRKIQFTFGRDWRDGEVCLQVRGSMKEIIDSDWILLFVVKIRTYYR